MIFIPLWLCLDFTANIVCIFYSLMLFIQEFVLLNCTRANKQLAHLRSWGLSEFRTLETPVFYLSSDACEIDGLLHSSNPKFYNLGFQITPGEFLLAYLLQRIFPYLSHDINFFVYHFVTKILFRFKSASAHLVNK